MRKYIIKECISIEENLVLKVVLVKTLRKWWISAGIEATERKEKRGREKKGIIYSR